MACSLTSSIPQSCSCLHCSTLRSSHEQVNLPQLAWLMAKHRSHHKTQLYNTQHKAQQQHMPTNAQPHKSSATQVLPQQRHSYPSAQHSPNTTDPTAASASPSLHLSHDTWGGNSSHFPQLALLIGAHTAETSLGAWPGDDEQEERSVRRSVSVGQPATERDRDKQGSAGEKRGQGESVSGERSAEGVKSHTGKGYAHLLCS